MNLWISGFDCLCLNSSPLFVSHSATGKLLDAKRDMNWNSNCALDDLMLIIVG